MSGSPHAIQEDIAIAESLCLGIVRGSDSRSVSFRSASRLPNLSARHGPNYRSYEADGGRESDSGRRRYSFDFLDDEDAPGGTKRLFDVDADEVLSEIPAEEGVPSYLIDPHQRFTFETSSSNMRHTRATNSRSTGQNVLAKIVWSELDTPALRTLRAQSTTGVRQWAASQDGLPQELEAAESSSTAARIAISQSTMDPSRMAHNPNGESICDYVDPHENPFQMTPETQEVILFDSPTRVPTSESECFSFTDSKLIESSVDEFGDDGDVLFSDFDVCDFKYMYDVNDPCDVPAHEHASTPCIRWPACGSTSTSHADDLLELRVLPVAPAQTRPMGLPTRPGRVTSP